MVFDVSVIVVVAVVVASVVDLLMCDENTN